jgi:hypothetical protein
VQAALRRPSTTSIAGADLRSWVELHWCDGWHLLPGKAGTKEPERGLSVYDATRDLEQIGAWGGYWPAEGEGSQILGATGYRFGALDVDPAEGSEQTIWELERQGFTLPATLANSTPHDGEHRIYEAPPGICGGKLGPGVTLRGLGSYIVLPPSMVDGKSYTRGERPAVKLPAWVPEYLAIRGKASHSAGLHQEHGDDQEFCPGVACLQPTPEYIPPQVDRFADQGPRAYDVSGQVWWFVANCLEWGMTAGGALWPTTGWYEPAKLKYGHRVDVEVRRILGKLAPLHHHLGQTCRDAGCPHRPRWQRGGAR